MSEVALREYIEHLVASERERTDIQFANLDRALRLQAREYERRLTSLNHAHEKAVEVQHTYVTQDKYEDKLEAEAEARTTALLRVDEKLEDYLKRYEADKREVDQALTIQKASADTAQRFAEAAAFKANRNIALIGVGLAGLVVVMNLLGVG